MNEQRIDGVADELKGGIKQAAGDLAGDRSLQAEGTTDRIVGSAKQAAGAARDAVAPAIEGARDAAAPVIDKARTLTRDRPWAVAALLGVVGMAIVGTLRGRGKSTEGAAPRRGRPRTKA